MRSENGDSREEPVHQVTISQDFYIGRHEVTQEQYEAVVDENPSYFDGCPNCSVKRMSWEDAITSCEAVLTRTGYDLRLPTEAEWEYVC